VIRTFLFGNGLSLTYNADYYALSSITARVRERLSQMHSTEDESILDQLERIGATLAPDTPHVGEGGFEDIAGPVDRLASLFSQFGPIAALTKTAESGEALIQLRRELRRLYKRVVGAVLEDVMTHAGQLGDWDALDVVAEGLEGEAIRQQQAEVFILNYDALLDAALLSRRDNYNRFRLCDEFRGWGLTNIPVFGSDGTVEQVAAYPWRYGSYEPEEPWIRLHHLHGAGSWMKFKDYVYKAEHVSAMRGCGLFTAWTEGLEGQEVEGQVEPVVLLGDQKQASAVRAPFNQTYASLIAAITGSDEIVLSGYGFGDLPINRILRDYRPDSAVLRVLNPGDDVESSIKAALSIRQKEPMPNFVVVDQRGLPLGFAPETW